MNKRLTYLLLFLIGIACPALGQQQQISGTITSGSSEEPLVGVTVLIKGTTQGAITDGSGSFVLSAVPSVDTLVVSYLGFETQEIPINGKRDLAIILAESGLALDEVVVTAFGLKREKKALGYSVQEVKTSGIAENRSVNVVNNLQGRVAGIQITSGSGVGAGSQVTIRGNSSVLGNNQPLYVIDGVPMEGDFARPTSDAGGSASGNTQYGGGISEISPDNIESITVLKGANAAALYGSRAANGVILITTKTGSGTPGLGVDYNFNMTWETPFVVPEFQNTYGGGNGYVTWYADGRNGGITDPVAIEQFRAAYGPNYPLVGTAGVDESWGAPMDGRLVRHWWSGTEVAPLVPAPDSWSNFWETGQTQNHAVAISGSNARGSFRLSMGRLDQKGIMYNTDFERNNFRLNTQYQITDKFSAQISSEYIKSGSGNRQLPALWEPQTWHHRHDDWGLLKNYEEYMDVHITRPGDNYPYANWQHSFAMNRFYEMEVLTKGNEKDRFLGNITLNYELTPWLSVMARSGTDLWTDTRISVNRHSQTKSFAYRSEAYSEEVLRRQETNSDVIFTFNQSFANLSVNAQVGGVHRTNYYKRNYIGVNDLTINGLYNVANNASTNINRSRVEEKEVNSVFGALSLGFKGYLFLDVTGRNDWSSTLPSDNNSYFYPSVSVSSIITDMLGIQSPVLSYAKLRASYAQVGNDTDPYQLIQAFVPRDPWNASTPIFSENTVIANNALKPEETTSWEIGADMRFLNGRLGLDLTYYDAFTTNQIMRVAVSKSTGYDSKILNAGRISNKGIEVFLYGTPIKLANGFTWDVSINYARNYNQVDELYTDENGNVLETIVLTSRRGLSLEARVGQPYGTLFGSAYQRVAEGEYKGQIVYKDGIPQQAQDLKEIGNVTPRWVGGINNTFTFKGFTLSALIDAKIGGDLADESTSTGMQTGVYPITALGREEGVIGMGVKNIGSEESPVYVPNDVVAPTKSVVRMLSVRSVNEGSIFRASYIKLREVRFGYAFPSKMLSRTRFIKGASLFFVGRNVLMLYNTHPMIDPEVNYFGGNYIGALYYATTPTQRSLGFNLSLKF